MSKHWKEVWILRKKEPWEEIVRASAQPLRREQPSVFEQGGQGDLGARREGLSGVRWARSFSLRPVTLFTLLDYFHFNPWKFLPSIAALSADDFP